MNGVQVLTREMREIQTSLLRELEPLTEENIYYAPIPGATTIAFIAWHITRTLDDAVHETIPVEPKPTIWASQGYHEKFVMPAGEGTGTGFTADQVGDFRPGLELLRAYATEVGPTIPAVFEGMTDDDLDRVMDEERPDRTLARLLQTFIIGHTYYHLGEIRYLKGLQGMPFPL